MNSEIFDDERMDAEIRLDRMGLSLFGFKELGQILDRRPATIRKYSAQGKIPPAEIQPKDANKPYYWTRDQVLDIMVGDFDGGRELLDLLKRFSKRKE